MPVTDGKNSLSRHRRRRFPTSCRYHAEQDHLRGGVVAVMPRAPPFAPSSVDAPRQLRADLAACWANARAAVERRHLRRPAARPCGLNGAGASTSASPASANDPASRVRINPFLSGSVSTAIPSCASISRRVSLCMKPRRRAASRQCSRPSQPEHRRRNHQTCPCHVAGGLVASFLHVTRTYPRWARHPTPRRRHAGQS